MSNIEPSTARRIELAIERIETAATRLQAQRKLAQSRYALLERASNSAIGAIDALLAQRPPAEIDAA